jgi:pimeloyl-ACP methyl ester carboxylesterase
LAAILEQKLSLKTGTRLYIYRVPDSRKPPIVMVHNMWGSHKTFHRHIKVLNEMGYTCITFNLVQGSTMRGENNFSAIHFLRFIYLNWIIQICDVLDSIPGEKIIFSFSGPSLSALIAASERKDIVKYICDGGPFREIWLCTYRLFTLESPIRSKLLRKLWTTLAIFYWGPNSYKHLTSSLKKWPTNIPLLSIRGSEDPIVYPENIDHVFRNQKHLDVTTAEIAGGHHLDGLKLFPDSYKKILTDFLQAE